MHCFFVAGISSIENVCTRFILLMYSLNIFHWCRWYVHLKKKSWEGILSRIPVKINRLSRYVELLQKTGSSGYPHIPTHCWFWYPWKELICILYIANMEYRFSLLYIAMEIFLSKWQKFCLWLNFTAPFKISSMISVATILLWFTAFSINVSKIRVTMAFESVFK